MQREIEAGTAIRTAAIATGSEIEKTGAGTEEEQAGVGVETGSGIKSGKRSVSESESAWGRR